MAKFIITLLVGSLILGFSVFSDFPEYFSNYLNGSDKQADKEKRLHDLTPLALNTTLTVSDVVAKAEAFKATLTATQITTLQIAFSTTAAQKWSNLPCGSSCRNGLQFSSLTAVQLAAAKEVIAAAAGTGANEGYDEFLQITLADSVLGTVAGSGYSKGIYFIAFLNAPSTTGAWMLQFGGHHYASNIAFNGGKVVGTTPTFEGVEPKAFSVAGGAIYRPINQERAGMQLMLASLSSTQLAAAKLGTTYSDVLLGPGKDGQFPATKVGLQVSTLSTAQQNLVLQAMAPWVNDVDPVSAAELLSIYQTELSGTYISYSTNNSAVVGDTSTFLIANTDYVRIDGPSVWIEFVCQSGVVFSGVHYHTIARDHSRDYGNYLARTALPLRLISLSAKQQGSGRLITWTTADESGTSRFEVQKSSSPTGPFVAIGEVAATNRTLNDYSFADNSTSDDITYYRLKMIDKDGYSELSGIVNVRTNKQVQAITVHPNPVINTLILNSAETILNGTIRITNSGGKTVLIKNNLSGFAVEINVSGFAKGTYFIQLQNGKKTVSEKFVKH